MNRSPESITPVERRFIGLPQFLEVVQGYSTTAGWIFRGQDDLRWSLLPKAGRPEFQLQATEPWVKRGQTSGDLGRFAQWRDEAVAFYDSVPTNDFECLAFAQHYGLATRLLDWSTNPLVALFFAVEQSGECDGAVWCHLPWVHIAREHASLWDDFRRVPLLIPRPFDRRLVAQSGVFTFHCHPKTPLEPGPTAAELTPCAPDGIDLALIRVSGPTKPILQRQLAEIGFSRKTLFPDLEGLSSFVNWETGRAAKRSNSRAAHLHTV